ncbi:hypothetical protein LRS10_10765 [Phenylobacterium sp. J426]|uniref:hypothetical protein n=1 Tax=Phenylobacterium sp. J426 TaxID=2898439 RepID=UPI0021508C77|nr:hypothetical protein [Phenylobacterium sp. J426]MCR5874605.1 hypothetical protein [Phenylobacterium sp. J426]
MVAIRQIADTERGPTIVFYFTLGGTAVGLVGSLVGGWTVPDAQTLGLLVLAGLIGGVGQLFLTEALRAAPIGVVAPLRLHPARLGRPPGPGHLGRAPAPGHGRRRRRRGGQRRLHPPPGAAPLPRGRHLAVH